MVARLSMKRFRQAVSGARTRSEADKELHKEQFKYFDLLRRLIGIRQPEWAERTGIDQALISKYISGGLIPTPETIERLGAVIPASVKAAMSQDKRLLMLKDVLMLTVVAGHMLQSCRWAMARAKELSALYGSESQYAVLAKKLAEEPVAKLEGLALQVERRLQEIGINPRDLPIVAKIVDMANLGELRRGGDFPSDLSAAVESLVREIGEQRRGKLPH